MELDGGAVLNDRRMAAIGADDHEPLEPVMLSDEDVSPKATWYQGALDIATEMIKVCYNE